MSARRTTWVRIGVFAALWLGVSVAAFSMSGCYGRNCEGSFERFDPSTGGMMLSETKWVSGPVAGDWLPFPRQRTWAFDIPELGGRTPQDFTAYISAVKNPSVSGDFTNASGNLAKFVIPRPNGVSVYNDSCSDFYLRLVLEVEPLPPQVGPSDAGSTVVDADVSVDASDSDDGG